MLVAIVAGWNIAHGEMFLLSLAISAVVLWVASRLVGIRADALVVGLVIVGYLVGNRGFAQLHAPGLPLLPGETALGLGLALVAWHAVRTQTLPIRRDAMNFCVLAWLLIGAIRIPLDFRAYGFVALRDFAMVYYALFFFLGQAWAELPAEQRWTRRCLFIGIALSAPVFYVFNRNVDWFSSHLTLAGTPLIYVKSDVAGGFMAAGVVAFIYRFTCTGQVSSLLISAVALFGVIVCNSRAAIVALAAGVLWLIVLRMHRMLRVLGALILISLGGLCVHAVVTDQPFVATPLYRIYESGASIVDLKGSRVYLVDNLNDKFDNNQFRLVWWRAVVDETWTNGRWLGLGFGRDLAAEFLRVYYADANEDFSARSPHNFILTVFGRMGLLGLGALLAVVAVVAKRTWHAGHADAGNGDLNPSLPLWLTAWSILMGACFGVVLEGPMAAVVFWTVLGMANAAEAEAVREVEPGQEETQAAPVAEAVAR